jgi:hypothetical protein
VQSSPILMKMLIFLMAQLIFCSRVWQRFLFACLVCVVNTKKGAEKGLRRYLMPAPSQSLLLNEETKEAK